MRREQMLRTRWGVTVGKIGVLSILMIVVYSTIVGPAAVSASVVWSEDFEDIVDWTIDAVTAGKGGAMSIIDGRLESTGVNWSETSHQSNVDTGTWSFDVINPVTNIKLYYSPHHPNIYRNIARSTAVHFMMEAPETWNGSSYALMFSGIHIQLNRYTLLGTIGVFFLDTCEIEAQTEGTWHFDVTLDESGFFSVFVNDTHRIAYEAAVADYDWEYFCFGSEPGASIDNIVVSDSIDVQCTNETCTLEHPELTTTTTPPPETTTTTTPPPLFPTEMLAVAVGVSVVLVVVVVFWRSRRG